MDAEMRKRLEEAENNHVGHTFSPNERPEISSVRTAFYAGAVFGYKEAIEQAKEWLEKKTRFAKAQYCNCEDSEDEYYNGKVDGLEAALADFEADMNKLLEEGK